MKIKDSFRSRSFRVGGYSLLATAFVIALSIAVNALVSSLPASLTQFDISSHQLFTISDETKNLVGGLEDEITIYWVVQSGEEDSTLQLLLEQYEALSDQLAIEKVDPDVSPTFLQQYEISTVYNNSLIVERGDRYRYVDYNSIYTYDYTDYSTQFAGEGALTSAIDYVTREDLPKLYVLEGHGESSLQTTFSNALAEQNVESETLNLLTAGAVPEDADAILIDAPQSDISSEELALLEAYLQEGGKLLMVSDPMENMPGWEALLEAYGVSAADGIVVEGDANSYAWDMPYYLLPALGSHEITSVLAENGYSVLLPLAQGLTVSDELPDGVTVTELLTTSEAAYSKADGYAMETLEKEDGDISGPFALAVAITQELESGEESQIVWVTSSSLLDEQINAQVSGGNEDFFVNAVSWMLGEEDSITIHAKSLSYDYLTMDSQTSALLKVLTVGIVPLVFLGIGIVIWVRRRQR